MDDLSAILAIIIAIPLGLIPANIAKRKGYSFGLWWFYGWALFIVAIIHVQFIPDKSASMGIDNYSAPINTPNPQSNVNIPNRVVQSPADELIKYKDLYDQGVLTEDEFNAKKEQLLQMK